MNTGNSAVSDPQAPSLLQGGVLAFFVHPVLSLTSVNSRDPGIWRSRKSVLMQPFICCLFFPLKSVGDLNAQECLYLNVGIFPFSSLSDHSFVPWQGPTPRRSLDDLWDWGSQHKISKMRLFFSFKWGKKKSLWAMVKFARMLLWLRWDQ